MTVGKRLDCLQVGKRYEIDQVARMYDGKPQALCRLPRPCQHRRRLGKDALTLLCQRHLSLTVALIGKNKMRIRKMQK